MTQPNIPEVTKQKRYRFHWYAWFPYPSSWLKSLILTVFLAFVIIAVVKILGKTGYYLSVITGSLKILVFFGILALLSPIPVIAVTHHILHLFLARFIPSIQAPEIGKTQGLAPGLISWWSGLYGWVVIMVSTLSSTFFCFIFLPESILKYIEIISKYSIIGINIKVLFGIIWMINAALIYQLEYLVKHRIISAYANSQSAISESKLNYDEDVELNQLRGEMGLHKMKPKRTMKKRKS